MGITVGHSKAITIADGTDSNVVRPSDWNSAHAITLSLAGNEVIKYVQAGTNSVSSGTISFADGNGVTFGMQTNGVITGTVKTDYLTTAMASNAGTGFMSTSERTNYFATSNNTFANSTHTHGAISLALTNISGTTNSASNGMTLSLSAAAGGGGGATGTLSRWVAPALAITSLSSHTATAHNGSIFLGYEQIPVNLSATEMAIIVGNSVQSSYNTAQSATLTLALGIYGFVNDTQITFLSSGSNSYSMSWSSSTTTGVQGMHELYVPINVNMTPGNYVIARSLSFTGNNASAATGHTISHFGAPFQAISGAAEGYGSTVATHGAFAPFQGVYSTTVAGFPNTIGLSQVTQYSSAAALGNFYREYRA